MKQVAKKKFAKQQQNNDRGVMEEEEANPRSLMDQEAVLIEAWGLQACFSGVQFEYEKKTFPRVATNGLLDLTANGVSVQLAFGVSPDEDSGNGAEDRTGPSSPPPGDAESEEPCATDPDVWTTSKVSGSFKSDRSADRSEERPDDASEEAPPEGP